MLVCPSSFSIAMCAGEIEVFVDQNFFRIVDCKDATLKTLCEGIPKEDVFRVGARLGERELSHMSHFDELDIETKKSLILFLANLRGLDFLTASKKVAESKRNH